LITPFLSFLPASLAPYSAIITVILVFVDGLIFGLAAKKALISAVLIIVGIILAGLLGISLPSHLTANEVVSKLVGILIFQATHSGSLGAIFYTLPIFFIIGFALGIWKG
jgi:hypothetical protein